MPGGCGWLPCHRRRRDQHHQIRLRLRSAPPRHKIQCGYAIFLAAFHGRSQFLGRPLGTLSKTAYTEAQIRNRTLRRAHAGRGAKLHARSLPLPPPPPCSSVHSMVRQGAPNVWSYHYGANARTQPTTKELCIRQNYIRLDTSVALSVGPEGKHSFARSGQRMGCFNPRLHKTWTGQ